MGARGCITIRLRFLAGCLSFILATVAERSGQEFDLSYVRSRGPEARRTARAEADMVLNHEARYKTYRLNSFSARMLLSWDLGTLAWLAL